MQRFLVVASGVVFMSLIYQLYERARMPPSTLDIQQYRIVKPEPVTVYIEPDAGTNPIYSAIESASHSIDMVMYELNDKTVEDDLIDAQARGVAVRVLLNKGFYGEEDNGYIANELEYHYLSEHGVSVEWTPSNFALTHQKTLVVDNTSAYIMTNNLVSKYYETGRDFIVLDPDHDDVHAIEKTFVADWSSESSNNSSGATPIYAGDDLLWSPGAKDVLLTMIHSAQHSLLIYNEEMNDADIESALADAATRGVTVQILMTESPEWDTAFTSLEDSGVHIRTFAPNAALYIHAKVIIVDGKQVVVGSQNFSESSLLDNRELGIFISTPEVVAQFEKIFALDWSSAMTEPQAVSPQTQ